MRPSLCYYCHFINCFHLKMFKNESCSLESLHVEIRTCRYQRNGSCARPVKGARYSKGFHCLWPKYNCLRFVSGFSIVMVPVRYWLTIRALFGIHKIHLNPLTGHALIISQSVILQFTGEKNCQIHCQIPPNFQMPTKFLRTNQQVLARVEDIN